MYQRFPIILTVLITLVIIISVIVGFFVFKEEPSHNTSLYKTESDAYTVIANFPHDSDAFTQGLAIEEGVLYEGTGLYGNSSIRKVNLVTGEIVHSRELPSEYFGEGITVYDNNLVQLTWLSRKGFVYEKENFGLLRVFNYTTEGWGIAFTGNYLVMSDGTENLYFLDSQNFTTVYSIQVHYNGIPIPGLNELEYVKGEIYANVFPTNYIVRINPGTGRINGWLNLTGLMDRENYGKKLDVLNGIAYDENANRLFVTGKYWPYIFELTLFSLL